MNGTSINGSTALHYAANRHDNRMVHFLLSREADPDMLNAKSKAAWQLGCPVSFFEAGYYPPPRNWQLSRQDLTSLSDLDYCIDSSLFSRYELNSKEPAECYRLLHEQGCCLPDESCLHHCIITSFRRRHASMHKRILPLRF